MRDIVIYCPGALHQKPRYHQHLKKEIVVPKILAIFSEDTVGTLKIQCNDSRCGRKDDNRGWYEIEIKDLNNYSVKPIPKQLFELRKAPIVVMGER